MIEPLQEFIALAKALNENQVDYAVCGGIALAMYGYVRATEDIDLLITVEALPTVRRIAANLGYRLTGSEIIFKSGTRLVRLLKSFPGSEEFLVLDLILVTDKNRAAWETRREIASNWGTVRVVGRDGLKSMKQESNRAIDQEDIKRLDQKPHERGHES